MSKRARLIIGIILMVLGVLSLMGLYLQTGMNLWTAFGVGLGASIFTIGLPCLGTFLIWGYKEKEKVEKKEVVEKKKNKISKVYQKPKVSSKTWFITSACCCVIPIVALPFLITALITLHYEKKFSEQNS